MRILFPRVMATSLLMTSEAVKMIDSNETLGFSCLNCTNETVLNNKTECKTTADFQYIMFPVVYSIVFVFAFITNAMALWYFFATKSITSPNCVFMVNLAVIDFIFALTLPFKVVYHALQNDWIFGEILCKINGSLFFANLYGSSLFLTCICIDRYIAVVHPIKSLQLRKRKYRIITSCVLWAILAAVIMFLTFKGPLTTAFENGNTACLENFSSSSWKGRISGVSLVSAVIGFIIPFLVIVICYPLIACKLMEKSTATKNTHSIKKRALRTILIVLFVFVVCFAPYHINQIIHTLRRIDLFSGCSLIQFTYAARRVTMAMTSFNSCLDPLIYYFGADSFNWKVFCCIKGQLIYKSSKTNSTSLSQRG
ncbi:lysophosphatidic acid receptor 6-like isoform X2 [Protopterus annectens]|nr:lysophosphatidic acid receptor 6-like isoform X2 [Protopterus annectens]XP_043933294.1 lysophosphatidic acid receptor 6-like isoform X2 [Protopterus annectens]XP_043933295.1 lysophosphatidic acid receptor 6-like isoform X2 [Protopterus annectens]